MIISFLWPAFLVAIGLIDYTSCILQLTSPVFTETVEFLELSLASMLSPRKGKVGCSNPSCDSPKSKQNR